MKKNIANNGSVISSVAKKSSHFKKGDIIQMSNGERTWVIIFKGINNRKDTNTFDYFCMLNPDGDVLLNGFCDNETWKYATEEKKFELFYALTECSLFWNEKNKKMQWI